MNTHRFFYDLEVLPYDFTNAFVNMEHKVIVIMLKHENHPEDEAISYDYDAIRDYLQQAYPDYTIRPLINLDNQDAFRHFANQFMHLKGNSEWFGWNSKSYDATLLCTMIAYEELYDFVPSTQTIRKWSDMIIMEGLRFPRMFFMNLEAYGFSEELAKNAQFVYQSTIASQKHVDVGALNEKSGDTSTGASAFMFPLKVIQSYTGLDVINDDLVKGDGTPTQENIDKGYVTPKGRLTNEGLKRLLLYNINDVISTGHIFEEKEYQGQLETKDTLRAEFPFLTKRRSDYGYQKQLPRDATSSQYAGKIIRGEEKVQLRDIEKVSFEFPFRDGVKRNVLDYVEKHEKNISPRVINFYRHVEGQDTREREDYHRIKRSSPTGKTTINVPYFDKDGNAMSAYCTPSWGGLHGGVIKGAYGRREDRPEDREWFDQFETASVSNMSATVDVKDVVHVDFSSYYPTMNIILGVYQTGSKDNYKDVRTERYALKDQLTDELYQKDPSKYDEIDRRQSSFKLVLNGATGASNQHKPYVDLPLDNATLSMRIIGNLLIYTLAQRFANAGGLVISSNTDGLYIANIDLDTTQEIVDDFYNIYGLGLEPEIVPRMVNKSANERIEFGQYKTDIGGDLQRSLGNRIDLSSKISYPRACGKAVINYIQDDDMWLYKPISYEKLERYIKEQLEDFHPIDWTLTLKGNRKRQYYAEDSTQGYLNDDNLRSLQATNRVIMVNKGARILHYYEGNERKISGVPTNIFQILNQRKELEDYQSYIDNLDLESYTKWAYQMLKTWHSPEMIPEIDESQPEHSAQLKIEDLI